MLDFLIQVWGDDACDLRVRVLFSFVPVFIRPSLITLQFGLEIHVNLVDATRKQKERRK